MPIPLSEPVINDAMIEAVVKCLRNEHLINGPSVSEFEKKFSQFVGTKYAASVNSGTSALFLSLMAMDIRKGDYVVCPSASFVATANSIVHAGAIPIFVDIGNDYNLDITCLQDIINKFQRKIKCIIPVHLYGRPVNLRSLMEIASDYKIRVIEDACQAHGSSYNGKFIGSFGETGAFSFYSSKNITVGGDGGMVTTDNKTIYERVQKLRNQGSSVGNRYRNDIIGYNLRLNSINAAFGKVQLQHILRWLDNRRKIASVYLRELKGVGDLKLPPPDDSVTKSAWHLFVIRTRKRRQLINFLKDKGIECGIHYPIPIHKQKPYLELSKLNTDLSKTEKWAHEVISLPIFNEMKMKDARFVAEVIKSFYEGETR